jgi:hypothetical protein
MIVIFLIVVQLVGTFLPGLSLVTYLSIVTRLHARKFRNSIFSSQKWQHFDRSLPNKVALL